MSFYINSQYSEPHEETIGCLNTLVSSAPFPGISDAGPGAAEAGAAGCLSKSSMVSCAIPVGDNAALSCLRDTPCSDLRPVGLVAAENGSKKCYIVTVRTWGENGLGEEAGAASDLVDSPVRAWRVRAGGEDACRNAGTRPRRSSQRSEIALAGALPLGGGRFLVEDVSCARHVTA